MINTDINVKPNGFELTPANSSFFYPILLVLLGSLISTEEFLIFTL